MDKDYYKAKEPLSREGLFQLITDEVFKDGKVEDWENSILNTLARFLTLDNDWAREIARRSLDRYKIDTLGPPRPLDPTLLYERTLYFVFSDGRLDEAEQKMLRGLRQYFSISDETHRELARLVSSPGYESERLPEKMPPAHHATSDEAKTLTSEIAVTVQADDNAEVIGKAPMENSDFDNLVREFERLVARAKKPDWCEDDDLDLSVAVEALEKAYVDLEQRRRPALALTAKAALLMVERKRFDGLSSLLRHIQKIDDIWDQAPELFRTTLTSCLEPLSTSTDDAAVLAVLKTAYELVLKAKAQDFRWAALGDLCLKAVSILCNANMATACSRVVEIFESVPEKYVPLVACNWSESLAIWIDTLVGGDGYQLAVKTLNERFSSLLSHMKDKAVRRAYARALSSVLAVKGSCRLLGATAMTEILDSQISITNAYIGDKLIARYFALSTNMIAKDIDNLESALKERLLACAGKVAARYQTDEQISLDISV